MKVASLLKISPDQRNFDRNRLLTTVVNSRIHNYNLRQKQCLFQLWFCQVQRLLSKKRLFAHEVFKLKILDTFSRQRVIKGHYSYLESFLYWLQNDAIKQDCI